MDNHIQSVSHLLIDGLKLKKKDRENTNETNILMVTINKTQTNLKGDLP